MVFSITIKTQYLAPCYSGFYILNVIMLNVMMLKVLNLNSACHAAKHSLFLFLITTVLSLSPDLGLKCSTKL